MCDKNDCSMHIAVSLPPVIPILSLKDAEGNIVTPDYATEYSAGFDLYATEDVVLDPMRPSTPVPVGLWIADWHALPLIEGWMLVPELQIRDKSGRCLRTELRVANAPGTVDCDYPDEIKVLLETRDFTDRRVKKGEKIAQAVINLVARPIGIGGQRVGGFGSTDQRGCV